MSASAVHDLSGFVAARLATLERHALDGPGSYGTSPVPMPQALPGETRTGRALRRVLDRRSFL